ncbi:MAG TPA: response regulator [Phototrophicaceae bacterium]|jgi:CheY-like chemotaxis protein|nr:response regulator [Phototrophicaceae bacterium]
MADILVVSNHFSTRIAYTAALSGYGYEVAEAQSVPEAQTMLRQGVYPRAIVVDVKLSPAAREAYLEFTALFPANERPALIIIGGEENAHLVEDMADIFLARPVELHDLIGSVQQYIA